jgi:ankyrin repeat protein
MLKVRLLLKQAGANPNKAKTDEGATPLFIAAQNEHLRIVQLLLESGAEVNKATADDGYGARFST